ncbi:hypothetical protein LTR66_000661 [Elasticomyces elasticus]|nr:hypothetical protein LTR28_012594 [Elasticomyces elasticus]KAK4983312.1 hypothetical protein LTR66_008874 [Elasticomyces elasticus]KAK4987523.1 hypothetical protein LTR50_004556 [Elasticomyces elasticus]KAK5000506.1 hypothetical protein LTR66_000661 [Elasticomyces elasticus]KAK5010008.1 hypothetical protein LTR28_012227 [Elasticomyces elasticus]
MTDSGRKDMTDKVSDKMTPDSQKSTTEQAKDTASGMYDKAASAVQPESQKSTTQKASDTVSGKGGDAESQGKGMMANAQETLGNAAQSVSDTLSGKK